MKKLHTVSSILFFIPTLLLSTDAMSTSWVRDLSVTAGEDNIRVTYTCIRSNRYNLSYKEKGSRSWKNIYKNSICPNSGYADWNIDSGIKCETDYRVKVKGKGRWLNHKRTVTTASCKGNNNQPPSTDSVRLKHIKTGKCIYGYKKSTWWAYNWGCWPDPAMAFEKINIDSNRFKLKHHKSGLCLLTKSTNGSQVELNKCTYNWGAMIFIKEPTNNGKFRLKSTINKCLYGNPKDGGSVNVWGCWNDPNMEYTFEY